MIFEERTVTGNHAYLPKPEIFFDEHEGLLIVATPWGPRRHTQKVIQVITDYFVSSQSDREVTSPFPRLSNLSTTANNLRVGLLLANEALYNEDNKDRYNFGVEIFAGSLSEREFNFAQVGQPHIWVHRPTRGLLPLSGQLNLATEHGPRTQNLPPLPAQLLGINTNPHIGAQTFRPQAGDQLLLINHTWPNLFAISSKREPLDISTLAGNLNSPEGEPFWAGIWNLDL